MKLAISILLLASTAVIADWPQWRGPNRNSVGTSSPALLTSFPEDGLKPVWEFKDVPGGWLGGWGSAVVAGGKIYVLCGATTKEPMKERILHKDALASWGWRPDPLPLELENKVEAVRLSKERANLDSYTAKPWAQEWINENLPKKYRKYDLWVLEQITQGDSTLPPAVVRKLEPIADKEFPDHTAILKWLEEAGIEKKYMSDILRKVKSHNYQAVNRILCLDANTGNEIWKSEFPGVGHHFPTSGTPTVHQGKIYLAGSGAKLYCLNAEDGQTIWQQTLKVKPDQNLSSSVLIVDDLAILLSSHLQAYDIKSGELRWEAEDTDNRHSSPAVWKQGDKSYVFCNTGKAVVCIDARDGKSLWQVDGGGYTSPTIVGDILVTVGPTGKSALAAYELSPDGPKQRWQVACRERGASPLVYDGHVYVIGGRKTGGGKATCVDLKTGQIAWDQSIPDTEHTSPVAAGGRIVNINWKGQLEVIQPTPEKYTLLATADLQLLNCISPALADGFLYARRQSSIVCFDLREK
ncbi:MAG: PQQ-like beta-propeller repeat protein [Planctomycetota bacterium]|nr:PQQ-like beta-propeller repeat protein [Planctomycetota bacterium]